MKTYSLNGKWRMTGNGYDVEGNIPGSVYSFLYLDNKLLPDPYFRDNELVYLEVSEHEYTFERSFVHAKKSGVPVFLVCEGLDTLCNIFLNGEKVADTQNMHVKYRFDVTELLRDGENKLTLVFAPSNPYIKEKHKKDPWPACFQPLAGFGQIRKAHCMHGWDWGPRLPDAGIWRNIYLLEKDSAEITDVNILQRHENGKVFVTPKVTSDTDAKIRITVTSPDGETFVIAANEESEIKNAKLWWPNGLGEQNLYKFTAELLENGEVKDTCEKKIGLRTRRLVREKDKWGESFYHEINGIGIFAMGADYIPEDNIFARITEERTRELLTHCKNSNFNAIRVWGGGYYPDEYFFDICDELGIIVFLDLMFACALYDPDKRMMEEILEEVRQNVTRVRHHACLGVISGNNENEMHYSRAPERFKKVYLEMYEDIFPDIIKDIDPDIPYIPSSPTSCGHFIDPNNENYGDSHYWQVWHGGLPFSAYRKTNFRYLSEFGFQSFPCLKTVESFTEEYDRNIFSRIMEMHQRNGTANGKIMNYLAQTFRYPTEFGTLLYASQLLQAEAIRYGVEHFRRNRGRCMGALYWQLNDIWPVASWASIDYYGRFKALQYVAKRFFDPVMISCCEIGETTTRESADMEQGYYDYATKATLCVTNDTLSEVKGIAKWTLRNAKSEVLDSGEKEITVAPLSALWLDEIDFNKTDVDQNHFTYEFVVDGKTVSSGSVLFTAPKYYRFEDPKLTYEINGDVITVRSEAYAKYVEIDALDGDLILGDNYFDMEKGEISVKILSGSAEKLALRSVYDIN